MKLYSQVRPETAVPSVRLKVRPDHALFSLTLSVQGLAAHPALTLLSTYTASLQQQLTRAIADVTLKTVDFEPPAIAGLLGKNADESAARLSLTLSVPLSTSADPMARAQRVALIDDVLRALVLEARKSKPAVTLTRGTPTYLVGDEARALARQKLMAQWLERVNQLAAVASVTIENVAPAVEVVQHPMTMEEVEMVFEPGGLARFRLATPRH